MAPPLFLKHLMKNLLSLSVLLQYNIWYIYA